MKSLCKPCRNRSPVKNGTSWLSAVLIIIIPKCPFCILAYSSAITMCGTSSLYPTENNWASYIPLMLSLVIILMIALNYRGNRSIYALTFSFIGFLLIVGTHQSMINSEYYIVGTILLFFSILLNGSLYSLIGKLKETLRLNFNRNGIPSHKIL